MLGGISAGYDRDLAGLQLGWRRLLLRRHWGTLVETAALGEDRHCALVARAELIPCDHPESAARGAPIRDDRKVANGAVSI